MLVPCGTTGESVTMTEEEDERVIGLTIEVAQNRAKVIAGAGSNSTAAAINTQNERVTCADPCCSRAVLQQPTQEGLSALSRNCEAIPDMPISFTTFPGRTSSNIAAQTVLRLARDCEKHRRNQRSVRKPVANNGNSASACPLTFHPLSFFSGDDAEPSR